MNFRGTVSTKLFSYDATDRNFSGEASTIEANAPGQVDRNGFDLESAKTGKVIYMSLVGPEYDNEGDVVAWNYYNGSGDIDISATIWND